jgi:uncharacterized protein YdaU (DUF1376 family)
MSEYHPVRLTRFDFDAADFLSSPDVASMTATEIGQYVLLLCAAWLSGKDATLPNDPKVLAKLARAPRGVSLRVMEKFKVCSTKADLIYNSRLSQEWDAAQDRAQRRHEKARNAAKSLWVKRAQSMPGARLEHSTSNAQAMLGNASESVSVTVREETRAEKRARTRTARTVAGPHDPLFKKFCDDYPRKIRFKEAGTVWRVLSEAERIQAVEAITAWKASEDWRERNGKFIPAPDRFLREGRWKTPPVTEEKGERNGRPNSRLRGDDLTRANLRAAGFLEQGD